VTIVSSDRYLTYGISDFLTAHLAR
jgi:hypothetical protein